MKKIKPLFFIVLLLVVSACSLDDSDTSGNSLGQEYFSYTLDGQAKNVIAWEAQRSEGTITVIGAADDGSAIELNFNTLGNMGAVWTYNTNNPQLRRRNHYFFKDNYFSLELLAFNLQDNTVQVSFSGTVYEDPYNLQSAHSAVQGSFVVACTNVTPLVPGLNVSASINGQEWNKTEQYETNGNIHIISFVSDDAYILSFVLSSEGVATPGNNNFNETTMYNKVILSKYNADTQQVDEYVSSAGVFNITSQLTNTLTIIEGNFSLTAIHPITGEIVNVTNGQFKTFYN